METYQWHMWSWNAERSYGNIQQHLLAVKINPNLNWFTTLETYGVGGGSIVKIISSWFRNVRYQAGYVYSNMIIISVHEV